jgi:hypothetical protein
MISSVGLQESFGAMGAGKRDIPVGVGLYPQEIFRDSRRWANKVMSRIIR